MLPTETGQFLCYSFNVKIPPSSGKTAAASALISLAAVVHNSE